MSDGQTWNVLGDSVRLLAPGEATEGAMAVVEVVSRPGGGPPPHTHAEAETFVVLDGELELFRDGEWTALGPGEAAGIAPRELHTYRNASDAPTRFLAVCTPASLVHFFAEVDALGSAGPPDISAVIALAERHGMLFPGVGAPA